MDRTAEFGIMMVIIVSVALFAMIFGIVYLAKRERMAMIERGMDPRRYKPRSAPYDTLKGGLLFIGAGVGLFLAYLLDHTAFRNVNNEFDNDGNVAIYFALIAIFAGLGLFISYLIEKKDGDKQDKNKVD
jgi:preprotein translocase subunit SecG